MANSNRKYKEKCNIFDLQDIATYTKKIRKPKPKIKPLSPIN